MKLKPKLSTIFRLHAVLRKHPLYSDYMKYYEINLSTIFRLHEVLRKKLSTIFRLHEVLRNKIIHYIPIT